MGKQNYKCTITILTRSELGALQQRLKRKKEYGSFEKFKWLTVAGVEVESGKVIRVRIVNILIVCLKNIRFILWRG